MRTFTALQAAGQIALCSAGARAEWQPADDLSNDPQRFATNPSIDFDASGKVHLGYRACWNTDQNAYCIHNMAGAWSPQLESWRFTGSNQEH